MRKETVEYIKDVEAQLNNLCRDADKDLLVKRELLKALLDVADSLHWLAVWKETRR